MNSEGTKSKVDLTEPVEVPVPVLDRPLDASGVITNVAKYFMTFLETNFMKRRLPKRNTNEFVNKGNHIGYELERYPDLKKLILKNFGKSSDELSVTVKKGQYTSKISSTLLAFIAERIEGIDHKVVSEIVKNIESAYVRSKAENVDNYESFLDDLKDAVRTVFTESVAQPLIDDVKKPLKQAKVSQQAGIYRLQADIGDSIFSLIEESIGEYAPKYFASTKPKTIIELVIADAREMITLESLKALLQKEFEDFATHDCYRDLYELSRSLQLLDKTELYLYLFDLEINLEDRDSFPLFYVPIHLEHNDDAYKLTFDNRVFVNTKGFEYVCQEYSNSIGKQITPDKFDRILYAETNQTLRDQLERMLRRVSQTLHLDEALDFKTTSIDVTTNEVITLSNGFSLFVFDKSDEALINDYEEILADDGEISGLFAELLSSFLSKNATRYDGDVDDAWDALGIPDKLLTESPIPLNEEQKKVVMALAKDDCKVLILEGPPGTGKSHTITAVICQAVLEGKSVLVLSDKKEALDVVEDKISSTLNKVRTDENFQNPILRLGAMGKGIGKVVDGMVLDAIKQYYSSYRSSAEETEAGYVALTEATREQLAGSTEYFSGLSLEDLRAYFELERKYGEYTEIFDYLDRPVDFEHMSKIIADLRFLRETEIHNPGLIKIARLYPGNELIESLRGSIEEINSLEGSLDNKVLLAVDTLLVTGDVSRKNLESLVEKTKLVLESSRSDLGEVVLALDDDDTYKDLEYQLTFSNGVVKAGMRTLDYIAPSNNKELAKLFSTVIDDLDRDPNAALEAITEYINSIQSLKTILGFAGKKGHIDALTLKFRKQVPSFNMASPEKSLTTLVSLKATLEFHIGLVNQSFDNDQGILKYSLRFCDYLISVPDGLRDAEKIIETLRQIVTMNPYNNGVLDGVLLAKTDSIIDALEFRDKSSKAIAGARQSLKFFKEVCPELDDGFNINELHKALDLCKKLNTNAIESCLVIYESLNDLPYNEKALVREIIGADEFATISESNNPLFEMSASDLEELFVYLKQHDAYTDLFLNAPKDLFLDQQAAIESYNTAKMAYTMDRQIIEYTRTKASELQTLKSLIRKKQKFPQDLFSNLKQAFPCILAGIRDYAEYIPLEKDLFDLIIIDEASQVSIAQALPAFIRGKKILILGDDKQFSNVKAGNASNERNQYFRHELLEAFRKDNTGIKGMEIFEDRINENFNVKRSVLDFTRFITNYEIQLKKHFRCFPEIISYSDHFFYGDSLQCVKLRTVPINEVIKFDILEYDGLIEKNPKTNHLEADFILTTLRSWKDRDERKSIGIITPHSDQASLISSTLQESDIWPWLEKECSIKIMTFDSCQGEERDYIFYSMVANPIHDRLSHIFAADLSNTQDYEQKLNAQRMNVGFSRAKNTVHFILSKPITDFKGEIQKALMHYEHQLSNAREIHLGGTDERSPMEKKVQEWLYLTDFYKKNSELEITPQFPIGQYLKYIDQNYSHPGYVVDFLLVMGKNTIILEYDGFKEHFDNLDEVDGTNYRSYQKPEDDYRRKILESYGYRFLRVNKFNLGKDPVGSLDAMLTEIFKKKTTSVSIIDEIKRGTLSLKNGYKRACDHCKEIKSPTEFPYKNISLCFDCYRIVKGRNVKRPVKYSNPWAVPRNGLASDVTINDRSVDDHKVINRSLTPEEVFHYLRRRTNERKGLQFRYKSTRANSDKKWREIDRFDFDREYFWDRDESHYMRYRVDRVVEIKG